MTSPITSPTRLGLRHVGGRPVRSRYGGAQRRGEIGDATADLQSAQADYNAVFLKWLGMNVAPLYDQSPEEILSAHDVDLESLFGESRIREMMLQSEDGVLEDDPATPWNESVVFTWAAFYPGDILVDCGNLQPGPFRACIQNEFADAYEVVVELSAALETIETDEAEKIRKASVAVSTAEDSLEQRRTDLDDYLVEVTESEPTESEIKSKVEALAVARATLRSLQDDLADLIAGPDSIEYESVRQDVVVAEDQVGGGDRDACFPDRGTGRPAARVQEPRSRDRSRRPARRRDDVVRTDAGQRLGRRIGGPRDRVGPSQAGGCRRRPRGPAGIPRSHSTWPSSGPPSS